MIKQVGLAAFFVLTMLGCAEDGAPPEPDAPALELVADDASITGTFVHAGSVISFRSQLLAPQHARLQLDINGAVLDVDLDLAGQAYSDDGHLNALELDELAALVALRDAVAEARPDLLEALHGQLLVRHADRMAEIPAGVTIGKHFVDIAAASASRFEDRADADGCGGDGATCLWGTDGWDYAVYDPGKDGTCVWRWAQYGESHWNCSGRCGSGCNHWFDDDYTWDCFDHDRCVDHYSGSVMSDNANCGDEFWDAADDYALTYGPWC